jgi:hypothetical protein
MRVACTNTDIAAQVVSVLYRHGIRRGVSWEGNSPLDARMWIIVRAALDSTVAAAIRRDIESIAGATVQE